MPDDRSLVEKLQAMASQTAQSPHEAAMAASLLERLQAGTARIETTRALTRNDIMRAEDVVSGPRRTRRYEWGGYTIVEDID